MSNPNTPFGLQPSRRLDGAALNFLFNTYQIAYNYASTIGQGDVVINTSAGVVNLATTGSNPVMGVFVGCSYANPQNTIQPGVVRAWTAPTLTSTTVVKAQVWDDPQLVFRVRANGSVTQTAIGLNATFASNGSPNSLTGVSTLALDTATIATTNSLPLRIIGYAPDANNDPTSAYPVLEVIINTSIYKTTTGI